MPHHSGRLLKLAHKTEPRGLNEKFYIVCVHSVHKFTVAGCDGDTITRMHNTTFVKSHLKSSNVLRPLGCVGSRKFARL